MKNPNLSDNLKNFFKKNKVKLSVLSLVLSITLTGCGPTSNKSNKNYKAKDYQITFVDGEAHFTWATAGLLGRNLSQTVTLYDANDNETVALFSYSSLETEEFSNDIGSYVPRFAIITCDELINTDTFSEETFQQFYNEPEKITGYIKENYLYAVDFCQEYSGKYYYTKLGIYEFTDVLNEKVDYHIGYNAKRLHDSDYIYDINDNKIYHKPETGFYSFVPISDLYDGTVITANDATELMNTYISEKKSAKIYVKNQ